MCQECSTGGCLCQARSKRQLNEFQVVIVHSSALDADHREDRDELSWVILVSPPSPPLNPLLGRLDRLWEWQKARPINTQRAMLTGGWVGASVPRARVCDRLRVNVCCSFLRPQMFWSHTLANTHTHTNTHTNCMRPNSQILCYLFIYSFISRQSFATMPIISGHQLRRSLRLYTPSKRRLACAQ